TLGQDSGQEQVRWTVEDDRERLVDRSSNLDPETWHAKDGDWKKLSITVHPSASKAGEHRQEPEPEFKHAALILTAGASLQPLQAALRKLAFVLVGLSLGLWLLAALLGRWLCRRALVPVTRMATAARDMGAVDLGERLPNPGTRDEVEDLS